MLSQTLKELPCPDTTTLQQFLNDELSGTDAAGLMQHVDSCPACQQALGRLVGNLPGPLEALTPLHDTLISVKTVAPPGAPPIQVPGYELLAEVGRGGMGVVYKARQLRLD